ncbi:MAG TPA: cation:proton antiporter [Candidatus Hypogeohydataceae bacterium YC38]|nr:cation:proton antiporter [Candidatus Brocadiales bacterium]
MAGPLADTNYILLAVIVVLAAATFGEALARWLGLPEVTGELCIGILLGNLGLLSGWAFFDFIREMPFLRVIGDMGAIILLVTIGLHTDLGGVIKVGLSSFLVAVIGVIVPAGLGFLACQLIMPEASLCTKLFLVASLCVNSAGIAIRVFTESGKLDAPETRIVIAATLLDVIFIFFIVGMLSGIIQAGHFNPTGVLKEGGQAALFLVFIGVVSLRYGQALGGFITRKFPESLKVVVGVVASLFLAYLAGIIGMSPIVGAFGAGLLMRDVRAKDPEGVEWSIEEMLRPAYLTLVPLFFVLLGAKVRLESFWDREVLMMGLAVTMVAVLGKLVAGFGVREKGINRLWVGVGMIPRAEMALIVASMGLAVGALDARAYSSVVIMVVLTSLFGPPVLRRLLSSP